MRKRVSDHSTDPREDIDYISEDGVDAPLVTSRGLYSPGLMASPTPVFMPKASTPLGEDAGDGVIPPFALWAMKYRRHVHLLSKAEVDIRDRFGTGNHTVYVIDDGRKHCMVGRKVGTSPDGCAYSLIGRITMEEYEELVDGGMTDDIFVDADQLSLCAVFEAADAVSNVSLVQSFTTIDEVPGEYLPPSPEMEFTDVPDGAT
jgi:hypothetical protein